jgi:hypothetical protein
MTEVRRTRKSGATKNREMAQRMRWRELNVCSAHGPDRMAGCAACNTGVFASDDNDGTRAALPMIFPRLGGVGEGPEGTS